MSHEILSARVEAARLAQEAQAAYLASDFAKAERLLAQAAHLDPAVSTYRCNLATARLSLGQNTQAHDDLQQSLDPLDALDCATMGLVLKTMGAGDEAMGWLKRALLLDPRQVQARINLANLQSEAGVIEDAVQTLRLGLGDFPDHGLLLSNLGLALHESGTLSEALAVLTHAVQVAPQTPGLVLNRAHTLLLMERWREGFADYEARPQLFGTSSAPFWTGEPRTKECLLIQAEQGLGDAIQFARFIPLAARKIGRLILSCDKSLHRLFAGLCLLTDEAQPLPPHDRQCRLLSLPHLLDLDAPEIFAPQPYLTPPKGLTLAGDFKVGLVWAGRKGHANDKNRSLDPAMLAPLLQTPGVTFYSLQIGRGAPPPNMTDLAPGITDLLDTASAIAGLDLLISVDTAPAHLAGALGKPVWTLLPHAPDWRWGLNGEGTPWYPSMRLFRQKVRGDWPEVIGRVATALETNARSGNPSPSPSSS
jgi:tetratricopeptide (TPR) repeat protein